MKNRDVSERKQAVSGITWWSPKRLFDFSVALVFMIPALPIIGFLILLVRMSSRGPGIYKQVRVGLNGKNFTLYKLRSMRADAETASGAVWSTGNSDNRVTRLGKFLRFSHLDELPQLFNVLKGEMSLVGPRPERPEITPVLEDNIPRYAERTNVLPGITGYAQVNLPPDSDLDSVRRKLTLDLDYIETRTLWFDIRIILCTLRSFLFIDGDWILKMFSVYRPVSDEEVKELYFEEDRIDGDEMEAGSLNDGEHDSRVASFAPSASVEKTDFVESAVNTTAGSEYEVSAASQAPELDSSIVTRSIDPLPNNPR